MHIKTLRREFLALSLGLPAIAGSDPMAAWSESVTVAPVAPGAQRHSIHSYFNTSPESPDGRSILFYTSTTREGHLGEVRVRDRASGKEAVLARNVTTEDAHRSACQQWIAKGKSVVFHDLRDGHWVIVVVDVSSGRERILAKDRMLSWGQAHGDTVPLYGPHWAPGEHRDIELLNVKTGELRTVVTAEATRRQYPDPISRRFGDQPISLFFPILSPDLNRVIFKLATPRGGDFRSTMASDREMLIGYDLSASRFLFVRTKWGHPAWHPDSRHLINVPNVIIDTTTGRERTIPGVPAFPGSHPSIGPNARLFATDTKVDDAGRWGVAVAPLEGGQHRILHTFNNDHGASSWRVSHPHPSFSPDGQRLYFNVSSGDWTELYCAQSSAGRPRN